MGGRAIIEMQSPEGAVAGQTATIKLMKGWNYHKFMIEMTDGVGPIAEAAWGSNIENVKISVNGDSPINISAAEIVSLNKFYGHSHDDGQLVIFLERHWMQTIQGQDQGIYKTGKGVTSFTMELELASGITIADLKVSAEVSPPFYPRGHQLAGRIMPWGPHYRLQRFAESITATGEHEYTTPLKGRYAAYAMHIGNSNISTIEVHSDGNRNHKSRADLRDQYHKIAGRTPQSGYTHIDFCASNRISDALGMNVEDFRIKATFTGTGSAPLIVESLTGATMLAV